MQNQFTVRFAKRGVSLLLAVLISIGVSTGCSTKVQESNTTVVENKNESTQVAEKGLPIVTQPLKLSIFAPLDSKASQVVKSYKDIEAFKKMTELTGIEIEWLHPPVGGENEKNQFNIMIATRDLPDMIFWDWANLGKTPGGPQKFIDDGIILKLNEYIDKNAPNLKKVYANNPDARMEASTDNGSFYSFPCIKGMWLDESKAKWLGNAVGPQIRKDWLDRVGMKAPQTIDEWYSVLKAFKDKDANGNGDPNDEIPFTSTKGTGLKFLAAAWGVADGFYLDKDTIKYGPIEPAFKDYILTMKKWYNEGLIDKEYLVADDKSFKAKVTDNKAGSYIGTVGGNLSYFINLMAGKDKNFNLIPLTWPKGPAGKSYNGNTSKSLIGPGLAITTSNKHIVESVRWADYAYSEEGKTLMGWGIENESYKKENGELVYTDYVMKNPDGLDIDSTLLKFALGGVTQWANISDENRVLLNVTKLKPWEGEAFKAFGSGSKDIVLPPLSLNSEESAKHAPIMNEVGTYKDEMVVKFIIGQESMDKYDAFVQNMKKMKVDEALKLYQEVLKRYNSKK